MTKTRDHAGHDPGSVIRRRKAPLALALAALAAPAAAASDPPAWTRPTEPFHLLGPIDYVGTEGLAAYLVHTKAGAILIDAPMAENAARIERSVAARVPLRSVRLILLSHAHFDHAGGLAALKRATGARLVVGAGDRRAVETGTPPSDTSYGVIRFPPAQVDRAVRDGERVTLGGVTLTAVATPGHTPGCTSWRLRIVERGRPLDVLFACSLTVAGNRLHGNRGYPAIAAEYRRTFARLSQERADVLLPFHPETTDLFGRVRRGALVDATVLPTMVAEARQAFEAAVAKTE